jgi:hypothetical protein
MSNEEGLFLNDLYIAKELDHEKSSAFCGMQRWRKSNEDFHKHLVPIDQKIMKTLVDRVIFIII